MRTTSLALKIFILSITFFSLTALATSSKPAPKKIPPPHKVSQQERAFINNMVVLHHFKRRNLTTIFSKAEYLPVVLEKMRRPFESKLWSYYRTYFITPDRIRLGVAYWHTHRKIFKRIQQDYGVDPSIVIGIIGVETLYGTHKGTYQALGALSTLAFHYPPRSKFFSKELAKFLVLTQKHHLDIATLKGSYAGALGIPQFMPSSYLYYGVNYDHNKKIDLFTDHDDAIASVANYLKKEGWKRGAPIASPALASKRIPKKFITKTAFPRTRISTLKKYGIKPIIKTKPWRKAAVIALTSDNGNEYWVTYNNFRTIMDYNPSTVYAMAVYQLSLAVKKAYHHQYGQ